MRRPTGSKVHLAWKCPASLVLPVVEAPEAHEPARRRGKQIHRYLERAPAIGEAEALAEQPRELWPLLRALDLAELPTSCATEVALAWNWRAHTARLLGYNLDRNYTGIDWSSEIPLTMDIVGTAVSARVGLVADYKTGHKRLPAPDEYGQTLIGGAAVRDWLKLDEAMLQLIYIHGDGDHHKVTRTVGPWELDDFQESLQRSMLLAESYDRDPSRADVVEGPWCEHCPSFNHCPAKVALVRQIPVELARMGIAPGAGGDLELDGRAVTVARAPELWMAIEKIEDILGRIKREITGFAAFDDIELPDGRVIGPVKTERRKLVGKLAAQVLERRYPGSSAEAVEMECSIEAFISAVVARKRPGEVAQSKKGTGIVDRAFRELAELGGVTVRETESIKPHMPPKKRLPVVR